MSGRDDDVFDVEDLRNALGRGFRAVRDQPVVVGVALAVVATALVIGLVPHALGAVGSNAVDTGGGPNPDPGSGDGARQRYQNYLTNLAFLFAPTVLPLVAVGVAFAGALRARGSRTARVGGVVLGASVGVAVGYVTFVAAGHLAYGEAAEGFVVEEFPVAIRFGAVALNALALAAVTAVGSALAGVAGTLVEPHPEPVDAVASAASDASDGEDVDEATAAATGDETTVDRASDGRDDGGGERPARVDGSGPASDYRDTDAQQASGTPTYDPEGRNWDGRDEETS